MTSVTAEGISMQHRWNDDNYGQNRIIRRNRFLRTTYPPDIPYVTSLFENRASVKAERRLTAFGTSRLRKVFFLLALQLHWEYFTAL